METPSGRAHVTSWDMGKAILRRLVRNTCDGGDRRGASSSTGSAIYVGDFTARNSPLPTGTRQVVNAASAFTSATNEAI